MYKKRLVTQDTYYVGASERRLALFENVYPLNNGVSYNSYLILDEKTCLLDSVDKSVEDVFIKKVVDGLNGRKLDYLVVDHMEPDHAYTLKRVIDLYPEVNVVLNDKTLTMFKNFNNGFEPKNFTIVKEMDQLVLGKHTLIFIFAPMVHWPEVMVTYDAYTKTLFSADAFGTFAALNGNLFAHEVNFEHEYLDESRRYYTNIVGKYGTQVQAILKKASTVEIETICPLHGPIWRQDINYLISLYDKWSRYEPEVNGALIAYGSIYGNTEEVANLIADSLALEGIKNIKMYDVSKTDKSYLVAEAFKYSHFVICSSTYNMGIFTPMEEFLLDLKYHNLQNRKIAVVENGSWAPNSGKLIKEIFASMKNMTVLSSSFTINSRIKDAQENQVEALAKEIAIDFPKVDLKEKNPLFNIGYGLYVLTSNDGKNDNGCIINSVNQVASNPNLLFISLNKANYTTEIVLKTKEMNLNCLTEHTPFSLIKRFGFASGKTSNKFDGFRCALRSKNNLVYLTRYTNSFFSLKVKDVLDLGSHYGFICEIVESKTLSNENSLSYDYYQKHIKPQKPRGETKKVGWICKICGYIYEGENLPADFICPLCKHPASDFEKLK